MKVSKGGFNMGDVDKLMNPLSQKKKEQDEEVSTAVSLASEEDSALRRVANQSNVFLPSIRKPPRKGDQTEHFARLGNYAELLYTDNLITDITLKVQDYSFNAHRTVLACYSPCLKRKLADVNSQTVLLSGLKPGILRILLHYMYTGELKINCQTLPDVFFGAKKLEMRDVLQKCADRIRGDGAGDLKSFWYVYVAAWKLGMTERWKKAYDCILQCFEECMRSTEFLELTCEQLCLILRGDTLAVRSEVLVFLAAMKWLHHNHDARDKYAVRVLGCVRFPLMTEEEIIHCFRPPMGKHIMKMKEIKSMLLHGLCYVIAVKYSVEDLFKNFGCKPRTNVVDGELTELWDIRLSDSDQQEAKCKGKSVATICKK